MRQKKNTSNPVDILSVPKYNTFVNSRNKREYEYGWNINLNSSLNEGKSNNSSSLKRIVNLPNSRNSLKIINKPKNDSFVNYAGKIKIINTRDFLPKFAKTLDKEIGVDSKFIKYPYRILNMRDQKDFIKSLVNVQYRYKMRLKAQYIVNRSLDEYKDTVANKTDLKAQEISTEAFSQSVKPKERSENAYIPPINSRYKGQAKIQSRNHKLSQEENRKENKSTNLAKISDFHNLSTSQDVYDLGRVVNKRSSSKNDQLQLEKISNRSDSVFRIGKSKQPKQIFRVFDDCRYPPNLKQELDYIRNEEKEKIYQKAIECLEKRAYYLKSIGGPPKGKKLQDC